MFFQNYWIWLQGVLSGYIGSRSASVAAALAPVMVTLATIYVMVWGYLQLTGNIKEPILEGVKRIFTIAVILGIAMNLWIYNGPIVDTFFNAPFALAASIVGAPPVAMFDNIWTRGSQVAELFWANAGVLSGDFGLYFASIIVWLTTGLLCVYVMFLLVLSRMALSILLAVGPFFVSMLFFDSTKRFFEAWIAQLANYGLISILSGLMAALLLSLVDNFAGQTLAAGAGLKVRDASQFLLTTVIAFLLMRQVLPIAAGLASGIALSTGNLVSGAIGWGLGRTRNVGRGVWDAMTGQGTTRWDPGSRKAGYWAAHGVGATAVALWRLRPDARNTIRPRTFGREGIPGAEVPPSARK